MRITKEMLDNRVTISFILNYLQKVQRHVLKRELPFSVHLNVSNTIGTGYSILFNVFSYSDDIANLACDLHVRFKPDGILVSDPIVFDKIKKINENFEFLDTLLLK